MPQGRSGPVFLFPRLADGRRQASPPAIPQVVPDGKINEFWASRTSALALNKTRKPPSQGRNPHRSSRCSFQNSLSPIGVGFPQGIHANLGTMRGTKGVRAGVGKPRWFFCRN